MVNAGRRPCLSVFGFGFEQSHLKRLWCVAGILMLFLCFARIASCTTAQPPGEYEVKAAFLYKFISFVDWPEDDLIITIGVLGDDPFGAVLNRLTADKTVNGKKIVVKRFKKVAELEFCHILFISSSEGEHLGEIMKALEHSGTLTVGDMKKFAQSGGIIEFTMEKNKIRFEINIGSARRAGLKISSKLLKLAKICGEEPEKKQRKHELDS